MSLPVSETPGPATTVPSPTPPGQYLGNTRPRGLTKTCKQRSSGCCRPSVPPPEETERGSHRIPPENPSGRVTSRGPLDTGHFRRYMTSGHTSWPKRKGRETGDTGALGRHGGSEGVVGLVTPPEGKSTGRTRKDVTPARPDSKYDFSYRPVSHGSYPGPTERVVPLVLVRERWVGLVSGVVRGSPTSPDVPPSRPPLRSGPESGSGVGHGHPW